MPEKTFTLPSLHLLDPRPPQAMQAQLERATDAIFAPPLPPNALSSTPASLERRAQFDSGTVRYRLALRLVDVLPRGNHYQLDLELSTKDPHVDLPAMRRQAESWIGLWTDGLGVQARPPAGTGSAPHRQALAEAWHAGEASLADASAIRRTILQAMHDGATFSTAHKEGGADIRFDGRRYVYSEYGDSPSQRTFNGEHEFLAFLRRFFEYQGGRPGGLSSLPEADAWRLILRRLEPRRTGMSAVFGTAATGGTAWRLDSRSAAVLLVMLLVLLLAAGLAYLKFSHKADALRAGQHVQTLERVPAPPARPPEKDWQRMQDDYRRAVESAKAAAQPASR